MKPYYQDSLVTLYHGDCIEILPTLETFDIAVTSPPYNMGLIPGGNGRGMYRPGANNKAGRFRAGYNGANDDAMPQDEYDAWQRAALVALYDSVNMGVFYNHRPRIEHGVLRTPLSFDFAGVPLRQIIVWDRGTGIDVNVRHFCSRAEWILLFAKPAFKLVDHSASGMGNVWKMRPEVNKRGHPAPFPVELPARCIATTGAQSVIDPFAGVGTTLAAALEAGITAVGIEKVEDYCETTANRLREMTMAA